MVDAAYVPGAGDIVKVDLNPRLGHEQGGWGPALVLSPRSYNSKTGLAIVVPITNQVKGYPFEISLPARIKTTGVILTDAIRNLDLQARHARYVETLSAEVVNAVLIRLTALLGSSKP
jgi:mRNA interferase MazF